MHGIFAHIRFDDFDLDARSWWVSKRQKFSVELFSTTKQFFYATLTLETFIWLDHLVLFLISAPLCTGLPLFLVSRCSWLAVVPG